MAVQSLPVPWRDPRTRRALGLQAMLALGTAVIGLSPAAGVLNFLYTPLIVAFAAWLLFFRPLGYIGFVVWVWMLTPLVRRLADYASGYHVVSIVMIAPLAATLLSVMALLRQRRTLPVSIMLPHAVILIVLIYGFFVGAPTAGLVAASFAFLNWASPVLFALYLLCTPGSAADKADALSGAFIWGLAAIGLYGIYQFFYLPPWDEYWMRLSELRSIGAPAPMMVRVFSTMNGPAVLAFFAGAGLITAMASRGAITKFPIIAGAVTFLLSLVRSAWGGIVLGIIVLVSRSDAKRKAAYIIGIVVLSIATLPIIATGEIGRTIAQRSSSLGNLSRDDSLSARLDIYSSFSSSPTSAVFGLGLGNTGDTASRLGNTSGDAAANVIDSGLLEVISNFGVVSIFMFVSLGALLLAAWRSAGFDRAGAALAAVAVASASQFLLANPFFGPAAICFYPFAALAILFGIEHGVFSVGQTAPQRDLRAMRQTR